MFQMDETRQGLLKIGTPRLCCRVDVRPLPESSYRVALEASCLRLPPVRLVKIVRQQGKDRDEQDRR